MRGFMSKSKKRKKYIPAKKSKSTYISKDTYRGTIEVTNSGNGYFVCDDLEKDAFISKGNMGTAKNKDEVEVVLYLTRKGRCSEGKVVEIVKRYKTKFTGTVFLSKGEIFVTPSDFRIQGIIKIISKPQEDVKEKDRVIVVVKDWGTHKKGMEGEIVSVLGTSGDTRTEMKTILTDHGLEYDFPKEVEYLVKNMDTSISQKELLKRRDMRDRHTFTIDPKDAKDFDDAISFEKKSNGNYEIGVHIADVTHYVKPDTVLDEEALARGTSIYMVDKTVPMLPEFLSNGLCSLRPNEDKLTFSVIFELTADAKIVEYWYGKTIIHSDFRFAYEEVQHILETQQTNIPKEVSLNGSAYQVEEDMYIALSKLNGLAKKLRRQRMSNNAISFDKIEMGFILDSDGNPKGVVLKESKDAHKLIEEFMLLANKSVAEYIGKEKKQPFIYRVHDQPESEKLNDLQGVISKFGYKISTANKKQISTSLNTLLDDIKGTKEQNLIDTLTIRTMSKANYSTENIGHYALAFEYYTHFTSPIRRYPDMMVHRLLEHYLNGGKMQNMESYEEKCQHCSSMEEVAINTERQSIKYMQISYMQQFIGQQFTGLISGVMERGIFVEIIENKCEGLLRVKDLKDDYYSFDSKNYALVGVRTKKVYQLGDEVKIRVKKVNLEKRHLDFSIA
ncbi:ribonuclease R [Elysia marginata]|uniref:exoribonuclease II n=1 Tax=Elysia marginata TaxID=1093978 RepID=A0AAV4GME5_9GAST|nr:ribonuclease R [Elysia marginata]